MNTAFGGILTASLLLLVVQGEAPLPRIANSTNSFQIIGMHCNNCASGIQSELRRTPGVADARVSFTNSLAVVSYDTNHLTSKKLIHVIQEAGYKAKVAPSR